MKGCLLSLCYHQSSQLSHDLPSWRPQALCCVVCSLYTLIYTITLTCLTSLICLVHHWPPPSLTPPPPLHTMGAPMRMRDAILERACVIDIRAGANLNRTVHGPRSSSSPLVMIPPSPSHARLPTYLGVWLTALTPLTMN